MKFILEFKKQETLETIKHEGFDIMKTEQCYYIVIENLIDLMELQEIYHSITIDTVFGHRGIEKMITINDDD